MKIDEMRELVAESMRKAKADLIAVYGRDAGMFDLQHAYAKAILAALEAKGLCIVPMELADARLVLNATGFGRHKSKLIMETADTRRKMMNGETVNERDKAICLAVERLDRAHKDFCEPYFQRFHAARGEE